MNQLDHVRRLAVSRLLAGITAGLCTPARIAGRIGGHVRRHGWGVAALFVSLSGGAYAATILPAGSVGTRQLRNGAVSAEKLAPGVRHALRARTRMGLPGPRGPAGPPGPAGQRGATGPAGAPGASSVLAARAFQANPPVVGALPDGTGVHGPPTFTYHKAQAGTTLLVTLSTTAYAGAPGPVTIDVLIDDRIVGQTGLYFNAAGVHQALPAVTVPVSALAAGDHEITFAFAGAASPGRVDGSDLTNVAVEEISPPT